MIPKPKYTAPCNGCGQCCQKELCVIGQITHGDIIGPCPSLVLRDGLYRCGIVLAEADKSNRRVSRELGIGTGCSMWDEDTTDIEAYVFDAFAKVRTRELHPVAG